MILFLNQIKISYTLLYYIQFSFCRDFLNIKIHLCSKFSIPNEILINHKKVFFVSFCDQSANSHVNQSRFAFLEANMTSKKNMRELKQYLFKLKWVAIKCYYVMASQIWQAQKDNAINKSYRRMHFMQIQKKTIY